MSHSSGGRELLTGSIGSDRNESAGPPGHAWIPGRALIQSLSRLPILIIALLVVLGIGSQVWQPFMLGFEHDDWSLFVRPHFLRDYSNFHPDRPGYFLLSQIILHIWDGSPAQFQWIKVVVNLATAGSIFWLTLAIQRLFHASSPVLAVGAATLWLIAPWGLGYTVWPTAAFTSVALLFFCASMIQFVRWVELAGWFRFAIAVLLWIISIVTYQSTWFGFVPMAFAVYLATYDQKQARNRALVLAAVLLAIQLAGVINTVLTTPKSQSSSLLWFLRYNLRAIVEIHMEYLGLAVFGMVLVVVAGLIRAAARDEDARRLQLRRVLAGLMLAVFGSCGSAVLYAAAGYIFGDAGEASKTTVMFTFWVAMGFSVVLAANAGDTKKKILGIATSCAAIAASFLSYPGMAQPWIASWTIQREVLDTIKGQSFPRRLEPGDLVLTDVPTTEAGIPRFNAPWSITAAAMIAWADIIPDIARQASSTVSIVPYHPEYEMAWEPGKLTLNPGSVIPAKRLWLWRWKSGEAVLVKSAGALPKKPFDGLFDALRNQ
jgi:hypothetical protein